MKKDKLHRFLSLDHHQKNEEHFASVHTDKNITHRRPTIKLLWTRYSSWKERSRTFILFYPMSSNQKWEGQTKYRDNFNPKMPINLTLEEVPCSICGETDSDELNPIITCEQVWFSAIFNKYQNSWFYLLLYLIFYQFINFYLSFHNLLHFIILHANAYLSHYKFTILLFLQCNVAVHKDCYRITDEEMLQEHYYCQACQKGKHNVLPVCCGQRNFGIFHILLTVLFIAFWNFFLFKVLWLQLLIRMISNGHIYRVH